MLGIDSYSFYTGQINIDFQHWEFIQSLAYTGFCFIQGKVYTGFCFIPGKVYTAFTAFRFIYGML